MWNWPPVSAPTEPSFPAPPHDITAGSRLSVVNSGYFTEAASGGYVVGRCLDTAVASGAVGTGAFNFATVAYMGNSGEVA